MFLLHDSFNPRALCAAGQLTILPVKLQKLQDHGVQELTLIAQDSTAYGNDLGHDQNIVTLLQRLLQQTTIPWLRLLYLYPSGIGDELLQLMADNARIVPLSGHSAAACQ